MAGPELEQRLFETLSNRLDSSTARQLVTVMAQAGVAGQMLELLSELRASSEKLTHEAIGALPEVHHRCGPDTLAPGSISSSALPGPRGRPRSNIFEKALAFWGSWIPHLCGRRCWPPPWNSLTDRRSSLRTARLNFSERRLSCSWSLPTLN